MTKKEVYRRAQIICALFGPEALDYAICEAAWNSNKVPELEAVIGDFDAPVEWLRCSFSWIELPEGVEYWYGLYRTHCDKGYADYVNVGQARPVRWYGP